MPRLDDDSLKRILSSLSLSDKCTYLPAQPTYVERKGDVLVGQVHLLSFHATVASSGSYSWTAHSSSYMDLVATTINYCNWLVLPSGYTTCPACQILAGPVFICSHYNTSEYTCNARSTAWYILEYVSSIVPSSPFIIIVIPNRRNATWVRGFSCYPMPGPHSIND